jgi:3-oxoacyl-[acyl-carrier-protein] synthase-3
MAFLHFDNIRIAGISACVPKNVIKNIDQLDLFTRAEIEKFIETTGVVERRFADNDICTSDLCYDAAVKLLNDMNVKGDSIDLLIFVTQTPDYHLPATSILLQHRLGLPKKTAAFDVILGCTGYVYGLSIAFSFLLQQEFGRALLLVGDTPSKIISSKDPTTFLLFGDAGTATLIEKSTRFCKSWFSVNSDGSGEEILKIKAGAYRCPSNEGTILEREFEDGSIRSDEHLFMDGMEVFNFTIREVPKDIRCLLQYANQTLDNIDYIVFHQANKFINNFLTKKLKYPLEKTPSSLAKFGNTSSATIPLTIVSELQQEFHSARKHVVFSGFGVGLSWANVVLELSDCHIADLVEA